MRNCCQSDIMGRKSVSNEVRIKIASLLEVCQTVSEVAEKANVSRHCVLNIIEKLEHDEALGNRFGQGRHRLTTASDDRLLKLMIKKGRTQSSKALTHQWGDAVGKKISP